RQVDVELVDEVGEHARADGGPGLLRVVGRCGARRGGFGHRRPRLSVAFRSGIGRPARRHAGRAGAEGRRWSRVQPAGGSAPVSLAPISLDRARAVSTMARTVDESGDVETVRSVPTPAMAAQMPCSSNTGAPTATMPALSTAAA